MPKSQPESGGRALRRAIHIARARAGITSDVTLAGLAPVSYDTLMNWYSGKTRPRGAELQRVARVLDVPYAALEAAYEGREPDEQPLHEAVSALTLVLTNLVAEIREERERGVDAASALLRAAAALGSRPTPEAETASSGRRVPRETTG